MEENNSISLEITTAKPPVHKQEILKYFVITLSVVGGSLIGPVSNIVPCEGVVLKAAWRFNGLVFLASIGWVVYVTLFKG